MKIRDGFVTNSSSTNFLIISKKELSEEYLAKKLGFKPSSKLGTASGQLVRDMISGVNRGPRYYEYDKIDYDTVLKIFGEACADKFKELDEKGFHTYIGYTSSDDDYLTAFFTTDHFVIDSKDFYLNGENCIW